MLREFLQDVLDCAPGYTPSPGDTWMKIRDDALAEASEVIRGWISEDSGADLELQVKAGGRQSNYGPVPWIRIYSPSHSPRTTAGFYLVYLFSADL